MCGIAGIYAPEQRFNSEGLTSAVSAMACSLRHRGPDDQGTWADSAAGIALGHRRLSIIDLSPGGHQPMISASGRFTIVLNGEIYNYRELREQLAHAHAIAFRSESDTEVALAAFEVWGVRESLRRFNAMFALALWDAQERALYLARDRFGEKPLYLSRRGLSYAFASELKAFRELPDAPMEIDRAAVALLLRFNCIPAPHSIYAGVQKILPGSFVALRATSEPQYENYWELAEVVPRSDAERFHGSVDEAAEQLDVLIRRSVNLRMASDVPLGAFLSGGIDSSLIVAAMQAQSERKVKTFSIGFSDRAYDEAPFARAIAQHLGTEHTEHYVTAEEALNVVPLLPEMYDEPFADSSQIPTYLVSRLARQHVTVSLSGDAGDELFGGYNRHAYVDQIYGAVGWTPRFVRRGMAKGIALLSPQTWEMLAVRLGWRMRNPGYKMHKLAGVLASASPQDMYRGLASHWDWPPPVHAPLNGESVTASLEGEGALSERMMFLDAVTYLPNDILVKVDRASMAVSLEARVPLLDPDIAAFAFRLPLSMKIHNGKGKWLLHQVLAKYVPESLFERPKAGFSVPLGAWLRGPLRDWAAELLAPNNLRQQGFFEPAAVTEKWEEHQNGRYDWAEHLWDVLMFQAWLRAQTLRAKEPMHSVVMN
jgi:asparagine synthase (glutamine-hydrolysing)